MTGYGDIETITDSQTVARHWMTATVFCCCYTAAFIDRALVGVAGEPIRHDLNISDFNFGLLSGTAFAVLFCLCGIPLGYLADRWSRRNIILIGILFWTAMTAACGLSHSFSMFALSRIGVGFGEACLLPAGISLLAEITPRNDFGKVVAVFLLGATLGNIIAMLGGGYLLGVLTETHITFPLLGELAPWRSLFLLACLPGLAVATLLLTIPEPVRPKISAHASVRQAISHVRQNLSGYGYLTAATGCNIILAQSLAAWLPIFYFRRFALTPASSAMLVGLMFLVSAPVGQLLGGALMDRLQLRRVSAPPLLLLACCTSLAAPLALAFCTAKNLWLSEVAYSLFNFFASAATPAGLAGWQMLTPERLRGITTALLVSVVTFVGVGLGPPAIGFISDHIFHHGIGAAIATVLVLAASTGSLLAFKGRKPFAKAYCRRLL